MAEYTTNEIAAIAKVSTRQVRRIAQREGWAERKEIKGAISVSYYDKKQVDKHFGINQKTTLTTKERIEKKEVKQVDELEGWNQEIVTARLFLCAKLEEYYQITDKSRMEAIQSFIAEAKEKYQEVLGKLYGFSEASLRRWYKAYLESDGNPLALASGHGHNKGKRNLTEEQKELIIQFYGTKNKPSIMSVREKLLLNGHNISCAIIKGFLKEDLPQFLLDNLREGKKEHRDHYEPFVLRNYKEKPNAVWMSDGHDIEMSCKMPDGSLQSPKLMVWQDHSTRMWVGWTLSMKESIEPIVESLKNGIERWGKPDAVYTDNGRAYKSKTMLGEGELLGIYASLGIEKVHHALPYNAQAKAIERSFRDFKETFAKNFVTYKGGHVLERPERLKHINKLVNKKEKLTKAEQEIWDSIPTYEELEELIRQYVEYKNHMYYKIRGGHRGAGMNGKTPLERMEAECPPEKRKMAESHELRMMCMYEEIRRVQQAGIELKGQFYIAPETFQNINQKVKVKYDHKNLSKIYVYKLTGEYMFEADVRNKVDFFNSVAEIKNNNSLKKSLRQAVRKELDLINQIKEADPALRGLIREDATLLAMQNAPQTENYTMRTWE